MHENLDFSAALEPIPEEIRKAAEDFIDQNPQVISALEKAGSAVEVYKNSNELTAGSALFFEVRKLDKHKGLEALESALIARWNRMHPVRPEKEE
jgi:hypothetical protein